MTAHSVRGKSITYGRGPSEFARQDTREMRLALERHPRPGHDGLSPANSYATRMDVAGAAGSGEGVMIHCRAKMIDGSPVTFEWIDRGLIGMLPEFGGARYLTEMIGEGFHVVSEAAAIVGPSTRTALIEAALKSAGVDTATAQWLDLVSGWVPLLPPMVRLEPASLMPGSITILERKLTPDMLQAGMEVVMDCARSHYGPGFATKDFLTALWCAMEKAR